MKHIYVICPPFFKTGGTELLHQLVFTLNSNGFNATIAYPEADSDKNINPAFLKYCTSYALLYRVEEEDALFVVPETQTDVLYKIDPRKCVVWWESVDNYRTTPRKVFHQKGLISALKNAYRQIFPKRKVASFTTLSNARAHLCQSMYAYDYLKKHSIEKKVYFLKDYINDDYFNNQTINLSDKQDVILYNPKKGRKVTKKIREKFPNFKFIPLINMTNNQVKENLAKAKVYIDFGSHPGMDRFPREAATMHCCVITNRIGSANYKEDVPIDDKFKFDDYHLNYKLLKETIEYCFEHYPEADKEFDSYREFIARQKKEFVESATGIFSNLLHE